MKRIAQTPRNVPSDEIAALEARSAALEVRLRDLCRDMVERFENVEAPLELVAQFSEMALSLDPEMRELIRLGDEEDARLGLVQGA